MTDIKLIKDIEKVEEKPVYYVDVYTPGGLVSFETHNSKIFDPFYRAQSPAVCFTDIQGQVVSVPGEYLIVLGLKK